MNPVPLPTGKNPTEDLKAFDRLPAAEQEMERLKDDAERAIGPESAAIHRQIRRKARNGPPASPPA